MVPMIVASELERDIAPEKSRQCFAVDLDAGFAENLPRRDTSIHHSQIAGDLVE